jgi:EpsI family protein
VTAAILLLVLGGGAAFQISTRTEVLPERARFVSFPKTLGEWRGRTSTLEPQVEHALGLEDYVLIDYSKPDNKPVNFYVAYYASQRKGTSPHSPLVCIPGGGWRITNFARTEYGDGAASFPFNRVVIERGQQKQIVYYWFEQRGRKVANEWIAKWHLLADAITMNRSDGALVRLTTVQLPGETEADADRRLRSLIPELSPALTAYLPSRDRPQTQRTLARKGADPA